MSDAERTAGQRVEREQRAVDRWAAAKRATADQRAELTTAITDLSDTLDHTRPERVAAATLDPASELWHALGSPPTSRGGLSAWCGIAEQLERVRDLGTAHSCERDTQSLLQNATAIIDFATRLDPAPAQSSLTDRARWQPTLDAATRGLVVEPPAPTLDHGLGLEL